MKRKIELTEEEILAVPLIEEVAFSKNEIKEFFNYESEFSPEEIKDEISFNASIIKAKKKLRR